MCGQAADDMKYECFGICDRMLGRCLDTGEWTDSELQIDPDTGKPSDKGSLFAGLFMRMKHWRFTTTPGSPPSLALMISRHYAE
jgi:hypothetical protein